MKSAIAFLFCLPLLAAGPLLPIDEAGFQKLVQANQGKVVLYDFWATWCPDCRAQLPQLVQLKNVDLVTISTDGRRHKAAAEKFIQMFGAEGPAYWNPAWKGNLPALFLYDKEGHKVRSFIGQTDMSDLEAAIGKLIEQRP